MAVTKVPENYRSSDGRNFSSAEEAERHDELQTALDDYDRAMKRLCASTARTYKTADGVPFTFRWRAYWYLARDYDGAPTLRSVSIDLYQSTFALDGLERLEVRIYEDNHGTISRMTYCINDLFDNSHNAQKALVEAMRKHIAERQAFLEKLIGRQEFPAAQ